MKAKFVLLLVLLSNTIALPLKLVEPVSNIYHKRWIDFNKNGKKDIFEDVD